MILAFYLRRIKLPDKWQVIIQNNGEYVIDWHWFIVRLFMNKWYFTKTEIIISINLICFLMAFQSL